MAKASGGSAHAQQKDSEGQDLFLLCSFAAGTFALPWHIQSRPVCWQNKLQLFLPGKLVQLLHLRCPLNLFHPNTQFLPPPHIKCSGQWPERQNKNSSLINMVQLVPYRYKLVLTHALDYFSSGTSPHVHTLLKASLRIHMTFIKHGERLGLPGDPWPSAREGLGIPDLG